MNTPGLDDWTYQAPFLKDVYTNIYHGNPIYIDYGYTFSGYLTESQKSYYENNPVALANLYPNGLTVNTYKSALLIKNEDEFKYEVGMYQNFNNEVRNVGYQYVRSRFNPDLEHMNTKVSIEREIYIWKKKYEKLTFQPGGPIGYTYDKTQVSNIDIPVWWNYDQNKMTEYLLSDSTDPTEFGGSFLFNESDPEPIRPEETESDIIVAGGEFDGSANNLLTIATIDNFNLQALKSRISLGAFGGNVGDSILSIYEILTPESIAVGSEINLLKSSTLGPDVKGHRVSKQIKEYDLGRFDFGDTYNNYLDFNMHINIYLPFAGIQNIDPISVLPDKSVRLKCYIDFLTGQITYRLFVNGSMLYQWQGSTCNSQIPITTEDYGNKISRVISAGLSVAGAAMNPSSLAQAAALGNAIESVATTSYMSVGSIGSGAVNFVGPLKPYIIVTKPKVVSTNDFSPVLGKPCNQYLRLGNLRGYTKVSECNLDNIPCTTNELLEIESLLKQGVIIG